MTSIKSVQFESTKEIFHKVEGQLANILTLDELDDETQAVVKTKYEEVKTKRLALRELDTKQLIQQSDEILTEYRDFAIKIGKEPKL